MKTSHPTVTYAQVQKTGVKKLYSHVQPLVLNKAGDILACVLRRRRRKEIKLHCTLMQSGPKHTF